MVFFVEYIETLMKTLCDQVIFNSIPFQEEIASIIQPGPMCEYYEHPPHEEATAQYYKHLNGEWPNSVIDRIWNREKDIPMPPLVWVFTL